MYDEQLIAANALVRGFRLYLCTDIDNQSHQEFAMVFPTNLQNSLEQIVERTNAAGGSIRIVLLSTAEG